MLRKLLLSLFLFAALHTLLGQSTFPIRVNVAVMPPYPQTVDEVINRLDRASVTLVNTDQFNAYQIKLDLTLTETTGGVSVATDPSSRPLRPINLAPGQTQVLTGNQLERLYENYGTQDLILTGITQEDLINSPTIPEGIYQLCMRASDFQTGQVLSAPAPGGCSNPLTVVAIDPPILTVPQNDAQLVALNPQFINFQWVPVTFNSPNLRYRLRIIDVTGLNINYYDAFESPNFLFYEIDNLQANSFQLGPSHPQLDTNHRYAVRVQAYLTDGTFNIRNSGFSDIVVFNYLPGIGTAGSQAATTPTEPKDSVGVGTGGNFDCNSPCLVDLSQVDQTAVDPSTLKAGDVIVMGHFNIELSEVNANGMKFNGKGLVKNTGAAFINFPLKVSLSNIKINANKRVVEGNAAAEKRQGSWLADTWTKVTGKIDFNDLGQDPATVWQNITNEDYTLDKLDQARRQVGVTVPLGFGQEPYKLQIVGINLLPDRASFNLMAMVPIPDDLSGQKYLTFGAKDICLTPGGAALSKEESYLYLTKDIRFKPNLNYQVVFEKGDLSSDPKGTYLKFNCEGTKEVVLDGLVKLDPQAFIPEDGTGKASKGDTLIADFKASFQKWDDWLATLNFAGQKTGNKKKQSEFFQFHKLEDYTFKVQTAVLDHSDLKNETTMKFPKDYTGPDKDKALWSGIYIKDFEVRLPSFISDQKEADKRVHLRAQDFMLDPSGLSGRFEAGRLLLPEDGQIGEWTFSIDSLKIALSSSNFKTGRMVGGLKLPITDSLVDYVADIDFAAHKTNYFFQFQTNETFSMSMWQATATLDPNSKIDLKKSGDGVLLEATLNGKIDLNNTLDGIPGIELKNITFENTIVRNKKKPQYVEFGNVKTDRLGSTPMVAGFGFGIGALSVLNFPEAGLDITALSIPGEINLAGEKSAIKGGTELLLKSSLKLAKGLDFKFEGAEIKSISVDADLKSVAIKGKVDFYKNDPVFGNGFEGSVDATFVEKVGLSANALFGTSPGSNGYRYFYVDAKATFNPGLSFAAPVFFYGFGGGFYYNLKQKALEDPSKLSDGGEPDLRKRYEPSQGFLGIKATVVLGMPVQETFNGDVTFEVGINTNTWGINNVGLQGLGYSMAKISKRDEAPVVLDLQMNYDFPTEIFNASLATTIKVPPKKKDPEIQGGGDVVFYRSPSLWYFKAGTPSDLLGIKAKLKGLVTLDAGLYFMMGQNLESPILPAEVKKFLGNTTLATNAAALAGNGQGFATGFNIRLDVKDIDLKVCNLDLLGIAGFDVSMLDYSSCLCNGNSDFGINQWYASGQGYLYVDGKFQLKKTTMFQTTIGALVEGAFPNPSGLKGRVKAQFTFGGTNFDINHEMQLGEMCSMELPAQPGGTPVVPSSPVEDLDLITSLSPNNGATDQDRLVQPMAKFGVPVNQTETLEYSNGMGGTIKETVRYSLSQSWAKKNSNGYWIPVDKYTLDFSSDHKELTFTAVGDYQKKNQILLGIGEEFRLKVKVTAQIKEGGNWRDMTYSKGDSAGKVIYEEFVHHFTSTDAPPVLAENQVDFVKPYNRQRYLTWGDLPQGTINFNIDLSSTFDYYLDNGYTFKVEFTPYNSTAPKVSVQEDIETDYSVWYDMPELSPSTIYRLELVAEKTQNRPNFNSGAKGVNWQADTLRKVLYAYYFRTSKFKYMNDKLNAMALSNHRVFNQSIPTYGSDAINPADAPYTSYRAIELRFTGDERFDEFDVFGHPYSESGSFTGLDIRLDDGYANDYQACANAWYQDLNRKIYRWRPFSTNAYNGLLNQIFSGSRESGNYLYPDRFRHASTFSYATFSSSYTYVDGPLTDAEVGLSAASGNTGHSGNQVLVISGGPFGSFNAQPVVLEVEYLGELQAMRAHARLRRQEQINFGLDYLWRNFDPRMQSGAYPFRLKNVIFHGTNPSSPNAQKTFNLNLSF